MAPARPAVPPLGASAFEDRPSPPAVPALSPLVDPQSPCDLENPAEQGESGTYWAELARRLKAIAAWREKVEEERHVEWLFEQRQRQGQEQAPAGGEADGVEEGEAPPDAKIEIVKELEAAVKECSDRYHNDTRRIFERHLHNEARLRRRAEMAASALKTAREAEGRLRKEVAQLHRRLTALKDETLRSIKTALVKQMGDQTDLQKLRAMRTAQERDGEGGFDITAICSCCWEKLTPAAVQATEAGRLRQVQTRCDLLAELNSLNEHHILALQERLGEGSDVSTMGRGSPYYGGSPAGGHFRGESPVGAPGGKGFSSGGKDARKHAMKSVKREVKALRAALATLRADVLDLHGESNSALLRSQWLVTRAGELCGALNGGAGSAPYVSPASMALDPASGANPSAELTKLMAVDLAGTADDPNLPYACGIRFTAAIDSGVNEASITRSLTDNLDVTHCTVIESKVAEEVPSPAARACYQFDVSLEGGAREVSRAAARLRLREPAIAAALPFLTSAVEITSDGVYFDAVKKAHGGGHLIESVVSAKRAKAQIANATTTKRINRPVLAQTGLAAVLALSVGVYRLFCMRPVVSPSSSPPARSAGMEPGSGTAAATQTISSYPPAAGAPNPLPLIAEAAVEEAALAAVDVVAPVPPPQKAPKRTARKAPQKQHGEKKGGERAAALAPQRPALGKAAAGPRSPSKPRGRRPKKFKAQDSYVVDMEDLRNIAGVETDDPDLWDWVGSWRKAMEHYVETQRDVPDRHGVRTAARFDDADQHTLLEDLRPGDRVRLLDDPGVVEDLIHRNKALAWDNRVALVCGLVATVVAVYRPEGCVRVKTVRGEVTLPQGTMELLSEALFRNDPIGLITLEVEWLQHDLRMRELALQSALYGEARPSGGKAYPLPPGSLPIFALGRTAPSVMKPPEKYDCSVQTDETRLDRVIIGNVGEYHFVPGTADDMQYAKEVYDEWNSQGMRAPGTAEAKPTTAAKQRSVTSRAGRQAAKGRLAGSSIETHSGALNSSKRLLEQYSAASRLASAHSSIWGTGDDAFPRPPSTSPRSSTRPHNALPTALSNTISSGRGSFPSLTPSVGQRPVFGRVGLVSQGDSALVQNPRDPRPTTTAAAAHVMSLLPTL